MSLAWAARSGSTARSADSSTRRVIPAAVMPAALSSSGTDVHSATRAATSGSSTMIRARSGLPPALSATTAAMSAGTPESVSHCTSSARGTGGKAISTQRLATVASSGMSSSARSTKTVSPGGSSRVLSRTGARSRSEMHVEDDDHLARRVQRAPLGQRDDLAQVAMETEAPLRRTMCRSGSVPASAARQVAHSPHPPSGQSERGGEPVGGGEAAVPGAPRKR